MFENLMKNPSSLAVLLGSLGQAVMGEHQDSWQAKLGSMAAAMARERLRNQFLSQIFGTGANQQQQQGPAQNMSKWLGMPPAAAESLYERMSAAPFAQASPPPQQQQGSTAGSRLGSGAAGLPLGDIPFGLDPEFVVNAVTLSKQLQEAEDMRKVREMAALHTAMQTAQLAQELEKTPAEKLQYEIAKSALPNILTYEYQRRFPKPTGPLTPSQQLDALFLQYLKNNQDALKAWIAHKTGVKQDKPISPVDAAKAYSSLAANLARIMSGDSIIDKYVLSMIAKNNPELADQLSKSGGIDEKHRSQMINYIIRSMEALEPYLNQGTQLQVTEYEWDPQRGLVPRQ